MQKHYVAAGASTFAFQGAEARLRWLPCSCVNFDWHHQAPQPPSPPLSTAAKMKTAAVDQRTAKVMFNAAGNIGAA